MRRQSGSYKNRCAETGVFTDSILYVYYALVELENRLSREEMQKTGFSFFGAQGPWYTVGWKMSVLIEKTYGRAKLIECMCDQRQLLSTYNKAAAKYNRRTREPLALWSESLIKSLERGNS